MNRVTERQGEVIAIIREWREAHGRSPSQEEIARRLGVSRQAISYRIRWLVKKGLLRQRYGERYNVEEVQ